MMNKILRSPDGVHGFRRAFSAFESFVGGIDNEVRKIRLALLLISAALIACSCDTSHEQGAKDAAAISAKGAAALQMGEYDTAEACMREATRLRPDAIEYWTGLGMAQAAQNNKHDAKQSYEKSLALLVAENPRRFADEAMILAYLGRIEEANVAINAHNSSKSPEIEISSFLHDEAARFRIK